MLMNLLRQLFVRRKSAEALRRSPAALVRKARSRNGAGGRGVRRNCRPDSRRWATICALDRARAETKRIGGTTLHPPLEQPSSVGPTRAVRAAPGRRAPDCKSRQREAERGTGESRTRPGNRDALLWPRRDTRRLDVGEARAHGTIHGAAARSRTAAAARADAPVVPSSRAARSRTG